jgi:serine/threonine-protein kinase RsbW
MPMLNKRADAEDLSLHFPATFVEIRTILTRITNSPVLTGLSDLRRRDLELVLAEALNNVAEHAYAQTPGGEVRVTVVHKSDHLAISIRDHGVAMPLHRPQVPTPAENGSSEGGRGWLLINALCRKVAYERVAGTNRLTLEFVSSD